jgi:hypothetical protein
LGLKSALGDISARHSDQPAVPQVRPKNCSNPCTETHHLKWVSCRPKRAPCVCSDLAALQAFLSTAVAQPPPSAHIVPTGWGGYKRHPDKARIIRRQVYASVPQKGGWIPSVRTRSITVTSAQPMCRARLSFRAAASGWVAQ